MVLRILALLIVVSCSSTKPTTYHAERKKEGYNDSSMNEMKIASFKANTYTKKSDAQKYAEFRAIEICSTRENKHANIIDIFDKTVEKDITRTSGTSWGPNYGFGMYPYYSRYSSFGIGVGMNTVSGTSWNEKLVYPIIEIYYNCRDRIFRPQILMKEISDEQMKLLVKDLKGALQVEKLVEKSPNEGKVEMGDIILKANGKRIEKVHELIQLFDQKNDVVTLSILRDGKAITTKITAIDVTDEVIKTEDSIVKSVCDQKDKQEKLKKREICKK
jgi:PDZ domain